MRRGEQSSQLPWNGAETPAPLRCLALSAGVATLLSGCSARPPEFQLKALQAEMGAPPRTWSATREAQTGVDIWWIQRFGDDRLEALVAEAERRNPDMRVAESRVRRAVEAARAAGADMRPSASFRLSGERRKSAFIGFPFGDGQSEVLSTIFETFGASLDVQWEIDVWGRIRAGQSAALAESQAAAQDLRASRASLAAQVAKAWFALIEANEQVDLATEALTTFRSTETVIQDRFETGADTTRLSTDLRLAKSDVASARAESERQGRLRMEAKRQLELILGRYPAGALEAERRLPAVPPPPPAGIPSELLLRRPDVLAAERRFASRVMRHTEAERAIYPRLTLTASAGSSTEGLQQLLDSDFGVWSLGGNVVQTILTGGRLRAEREIRKEEQIQALAELQKRVLAAFFEVENGLTADSYLAREQAALEEAVDLAAEADTEARADYAGGVGDILTVLAAQNRFLAARSQLIMVRRLRLDNRVNVHLALGGDYVLRPAADPRS